MTWSNVILKKNSLQVTVSTSQIRENLTKQLTNIVPPKSSAQFSTAPGDSDYGPNSTLIVDLLRLEDRLTIDGTIATGFGTSDSSSDASDKRDDLKNIVKAGGQITMTFEGSDIIGNIDKLDIRHDGGMDGIEPTDGEDGFIVAFTFVIGVDI